MRLVIIGGSDAGISAALRARELDPSTEAHLVVADAFPNFSICGLPFYLSGEIPDWRTLAHRTRDEIEAAGIHLHLNQTAIAIDPSGKSVTTRSGSIQGTIPYDRLVIGTGAEPVLPPIPGVDRENVFVLHTMDDSFALNSALEKNPRSAVIVGAGYIGLEMADALRHRGIAVTLIEQLPAVLRTVDVEVGKRVEDLLRAHDVDVRTNTTVTAIEGNGDRLRVVCADGNVAHGEIVLVVVGVRPQSQLARDCGIATDARSAIIVDRAMRTNLPDIYAAGDCVATWHRFLERDVYMPLGTTSHKQGRVAGENAVGGDALFAGALGTQSVKIFDHVVAATGLRESEGQAYGFDPFAIDIRTYDHKVYYPGATEMLVRVVGDRSSGLLLGAQIMGSYGKEVSKRIDTAATALYHRMQVEDLSALDLSYTPPLSSPWDPVQMAAQAWTLRRASAALASSANS